MEGIAVQPAAPSYRWVVLAAGSFATAAYAGAQAGLPALGPALRDRYGLSLAEVGVALTAIPLGVTMMILPWGMLSDRVGERRVIAGGLAGGAVALVAAAFTSTFAALLVALVVAGMCGASTTGAGGRAVMGWFATDERGFALSIRQTAGPAGAALMSVVLPQIAGASGVRACFLTLAGIMLTAAVCAGALVREPLNAGALRAAHPSRGSPIRERRLWRLGLGCALMCFGQGAIFAFIVLFLHDERGFSTGAAAAGLAAVQLGGAAARPALGRFSDRRGARVPAMRACAASGAVLLAGVALLVHGPGALLYPVLLLASIAAMSWNGLGVTVAAELSGYLRAGTAMGLYITTITLALTVAAVTFGGLVSLTSWSWGFAVLAALSLGGYVVLGPLVADERRRLHPSDSALGAPAPQPI